MRYILNSAVITAFGTFSYSPASAHEARMWLQKGGWESTVGYANTAHALSVLTGIDIPVNRKTVKMEPGDEALVFRLVLPPGSPRLSPNEKDDSLSSEFVLENCEIGIIRFIDNAIWRRLS